MAGRLLLGLAILATLLGAPAWAGDVHRSLTLDSPALGGPLAYSIYVPDGHEGDGPALPTIYLLHGLGGGETDYLNAADLEATTDRLITMGALPPVLIVMPDGGDSWYVDRPDGRPGIATAIGRDLTAEIERRWNARPGGGARAIAGLSMGGFGALRLAFFHPGDWAAVAAMSPAIVPPGSLDAAPHALPIDLFRGAFGESFEPAQHAAASPFTALDALAQHQAPPPTYLTVGDDDYFGLEVGTMTLALAMKRRGLPVEIRVRDGDHTWPFWRQELPDVLRFVGMHLD